ncbi:MAG: UbiD family decarboxylase domain-containing protein, partial [Nitrososphaeria archaeon]
MSLRSALEEIMKALPGEVIEINKQVSINYEITAYAEALSASSPVLIFRNVNNFPGTTVVSNMFSSRSKIAAYLGVKEKELNEKWVSIINRNSGFSIKGNDGPVKEVALMGDKVDLYSLPVLMHYPQDGGRYITSGITVARDTDGTVNLSFARIQLIGKDRIALSMHSRGHLWSYYLHAKEIQRDLPISI